LDQEGPLQESSSSSSQDSHSSQPYTLPESFEWCELSFPNADETCQNQAYSDLLDLYNLLSRHYVEHSSAEFRFDYSPEFLIWALKSVTFRGRNNN
jgi:glycylpeptide N-tetradecanoyltransferase